MGLFQKWITVGNGENAKHVQVQENDNSSEPTLFNLRTDPSSTYTEIVDALGVMYNTTNTDIDLELKVKEIVESFRESIPDDIAFRQLKDHVEHLYLRLVNLQQHIKNLNQVVTSKGISLSHLSSLVESLLKQSVEVFSYIEKLPQRATEDGQEAVSAQEQVVNSLNGMLGQVIHLKELDYTRKKERTSRGWDHLGKAALNRYVKQAQNQPPGIPVPQPSGEVADDAFAMPASGDQEP